MSKRQCTLHVLTVSSSNAWVVQSTADFHQANRVRWLLFAMTKVARAASSLHARHSPSRFTLSETPASAPNRLAISFD